MIEHRDIRLIKKNNSVTLCSEKNWNVKFGNHICMWFEKQWDSSFYNYPRKKFAN